MKICDFQTGAGRLQRDTKKLKDKWLDTKTHWQDKTSAEFEQKYLAPLLPNLKLALGAVYELAETVDEAQQELGDERSGEDARR